MSLFFLFAAGLFATMHNHQLVSLIVIRLSIYFAAFAFIPVRDIVMTGAGIETDLWAQLFTSLFVVFFIVESARSYYRFYKIQINQIEALREEHAKTEEALRAKTEFVSTMSHELRTPLTSIKGAVDLLEAEKLGPLPDTAKSTLKIAQRNCARLLKLISEILDIQKLESGNFKISPQEIDLHEVILDSVLENETYSSQFGVSVQYERSDQTALIWADASRLQQVFSNVLSNAAKFSFPGGTVKVDVEHLDDAFRVHFRDEGIGLSEDDEDKVFDQFSQLDSSDTRRHDGTGLGMNISKQILEAHGGLIWYSKNEGDGTTFSVELPSSSDHRS
jgi:signal transduction histidine kinase